MIAVTPGPLAPALKEEYPEIIRSSRYILIYIMSLQKGDEFIMKNWLPLLIRTFWKCLISSLFMEI